MSHTRLALLGGKPLGPVAPDQHPTFSKRALARVQRLLEKGMTVGLGKHHPVIREAEEAIAEWQGVKHCMVLSSGHAALHMALTGLEVGPDDEVITTPYSWGASVSCILHCGAIPVFTDVLPETGLMDPGLIEARITRRTRAILPVHIHGQATNMPAIRRIAKRHGIAVVEDGSQAHGAEFAGRKVGQFGDASGFSCMGFKLLGTTEAGYLATRHEDVYWKAALFCQHMGRSPDPGFPTRFMPSVDSLVYSYRLSPIAAVLLTEQLKKVDREVEGRRKNVARLQKHLKTSRCLCFPRYGKRERPGYYTLSMNFSEQAAGVRKETYLKALAAEGVVAGSYVPSPIPHWERMRPKGYNGPRRPWGAQLRRAGVRYRSEAYPGCEAKIAQAVDMDWNYIRQDAVRMSRLAEVFLKVEENLAALQAWEQRQQKRNAKASRKAKPTRREVL